jgi:hypothetical protein
MGEVLEVVLFTVKDGERDAFLDERGPAIAALAAACPGLLDARLAEYEDGTWIDVLRWRSLDEARAATERMPQLDAARRWAAHIAEVRDFRHATLHDLRDVAAV